jgi:hypothetical protein
VTLLEPRSPLLLPRPIFGQHRKIQAVRGGQHGGQVQGHGVIHGAVQLGEMLSQNAGEDDWGDQLLPLLVPQPAQQLAHGSGFHAGEGVDGCDIIDSDVELDKVKDGRIVRLQYI